MKPFSFATYPILGSDTLKSFFNILAYLLGGFDKNFIVFLIVLLIDFLTNISYYIYEKKYRKILSSKNFLKVLGYFLVLAFANVIDKILVKESMMRQMLIYFFIASMGMSIMELWVKMGIPLPHKIFGVLKELKEEEDGEETLSEKSDSKEGSSLSNQ